MATYITPSLLYTPPTGSGIVTYISPTVTTTSLYSTSTAGSNSYTIPSGVSGIYVVISGGGGGGGASASGYASGGAAGAVAQGYFAVTPGQEYTINIGTGGAGYSASADGDGKTGGSSTFVLGSTTLLTAAGGTGGNDSETEAASAGPFSGYGGSPQVGNGDGGNSIYSGGAALNPSGSGPLAGGGGGGYFGAGAAGNDTTLSPPVGGTSAGGGGSYEDYGTSGGPGACIIYQVA